MWLGATLQQIVLMTESVMTVSARIHARIRTRAMMVKPVAMMVSVPAQPRAVMTIPPALVIKSAWAVPVRKTQTKAARMRLIVSVIDSAQKVPVERRARNYRAI